MAGGGDRESRRFRFELSRLELAGVVVSTAASLFIVFLLGVYAGHGLGDRRLDDAERIVRLPVAPAAAEETPAPEEDLTFDDTLGDDDHPAKAASAGHPPAGDMGHERSTESATHDRGAGDAAAVERLAAGEHAAPPAHGAPTPAPTAGRGAAGGPRPAEASVALAIAKPPPASGAGSPSENGAWSVQVTATREPHTADDLLKRLRAKGYDAYIVRARREGAMFYRVRVGHYPSMERASQMVSRLRREPGVPEAFVASD